MHTSHRDDAYLEPCCAKDHGPGGASSAEMGVSPAAPPARPLADRLIPVSVPAVPTQRPVLAAGEVAALIALRHLAKTYPGQLIALDLDGWKGQSDG